MRRSLSRSLVRDEGICNINKSDNIGALIAASCIIYSKSKLGICWYTCGATVSKKVYTQTKKTI